MRSIVLTACLLLSPVPLPAGETDYVSLYQVFRASRSVSSFERLIAVPRIQSKDPSVSPESITLRIRARSGDIPLIVGHDGRVDFPMSDELASENPRVISNQPPGSLSVSLVVEVKAPAAARVAYVELLEAMNDVETAIGAAGKAGQRTVIEGLEFRFDPTLGAHASIRRELGDELLIADPQGRLFLRRRAMSAELAQTVVEFSAPPVRVLPRFAASH